MTTYSETDHPRAADGKYAPKRSGESNLSISVDDPDASQRVLETSKRLVIYLTRNSPDLDAEDIQGEVAYKVWTQLERQRTMANFNSVVHQITKAEIYSRLHGPDGRNSGAHREWEREVIAKREKMGRQLTHAEQVEIADKVRLSKPPGRRPVPEFYRYGATDHRTVSLNEPIGSGEAGERNDDQSGDLLLRRHHVSDEAGGHYEMGSAGDEVTELAHGDRSQKAAARLRAWDTVAASSGLTSTGPNMASAGERTRARSVIVEAGAASVASRILSGDASEDEEAAFSQPWPHANSAQINDIAHELSERPAYANDLWTAAHESSVAKHATFSSQPLPTVNAPVLRADSAKSAREYVASRGGAQAMARRYLAGGGNARDTEVLMAPWGGSRSVGGNARLVATRIAVNTDENQWDHALNSATRVEDGVDEYGYGSW